MISMNYFYYNGSRYVWQGNHKLSRFEISWVLYLCCVSI